jgi:hypoxanthine phosphoribosyltransferase
MIIKEFVKTSYEEADKLSRELAKKVSEDFKIETLVAPARGAFIPTRIIADELSIREIYSIGVKRFEKTGEGSQIAIYQDVPPDAVRFKNVLVAEEIIDEGLTSQKIVKNLNFYGPKEIRVATIDLKDASCFKPDYYMRFFPSTTWIVYDWMLKETVLDLLEKSENEMEAVKNLKKLDLDERSCKKYIEEHFKKV